MTLYIIWQPNSITKTSSIFVWYNFVHTYCRTSPEAVINMVLLYFENTRVIQLIYCHPSTSFK